MALTQILNSKCFGGYQKVCILKSSELTCDTKFSIYLPPAAEKKRVPVLYWLSDLASDHETFIQTSGVQSYAAEHNICIVCPDTSPRNINIPELNRDQDVGAGAGFYVDAIKYPWSKHFKMYTYVTFELISVINRNFPVITNKLSISGFSMGGHGAMVCALKNPGLYSSVSALAPLSNPIKSPISQKAYNAYFGDVSNGYWNLWDATELVTNYNGGPMEIFIDQGADDDLYRKEMLHPESFFEAAKRNKRVKCLLKWRCGYKHDCFYVASVIQEHIEYHSKFLNSDIKTNNFEKAKFI